MKTARVLVTLLLLGSLSLQATGWTNCCCGVACTHRNDCTGCEAPDTRPAPPVPDCGG